MPIRPLTGLRLVVAGVFTCLIRENACLFFPQSADSDPDWCISLRFGPGYVSLYVSLDGGKEGGTAFRV